MINFFIQYFLIIIRVWEPLPAIQTKIPSIYICQNRIEGRQCMARHHPDPLYTPRPLSRGTSMIPVKQFTSLASLSHVLLHATLITFLALNMVMTLPALS